MTPRGVRRGQALVSLALARAARMGKKIYPSSLVITPASFARSLGERERESRAAGDRVGPQSRKALLDTSNIFREIHRKGAESVSRDATRTPAGDGVEEPPRDQGC